jgi:pimeloyl-ACP methyl ester carboxylesterase
MIDYSVLPGITSSSYPTSRLAVHALTRGERGGAPVIFLHGNASASRFWEETMLALPEGFHAIAPDLRGYGRTEPKAIDATRGVRDFSDDLHALITESGLVSDGVKVHLVGWSVGGGVAMQYAIDHADRVASIVLEATMSPHGFGGTKDVKGTPCADDHAGSGGGTANPEFVKRIGAGDASEESDFSPRKVMNQFYFKPPFRAELAREDVFVAEILSSRPGDGFYPGDLTTSTNWPGIAPGKGGMNNAISPKYLDLSAFSRISPRPPVLWIRGADDQIVSDTSLFDLAFLGQLGAVPGWPGAEACPPQPMIGQIRAVLDAYRANGGAYREEVLPGVGNSPHVEAPAAYRTIVFPFLQGR